MKTTILIAAALSLFVACDQKSKQAYISDHEKDSLLAVVNNKDAALNELIASFNEIEQNIDSVAAKQHLIRLDAKFYGELKPNQKQRISDQIVAINNLMDENKKKVEALNKKLKGSSFKNANLDKMLAIVTGQLNQKNLELKEMNAELTRLNAKVAQLQDYAYILSEYNDSQSKTIADETEALQTAYYILGTQKELKNARVIDRKGGVLGIGRTTKLSVDFEENHFMCIDYTLTTSIAVNSKMNIVTNHPSSSYTLEMDKDEKDKVTNVLITNPQLFWSQSKYLVIVKS